MLQESNNTISGDVHLKGQKPYKFGFVSEELKKPGLRIKRTGEPAQYAFELIERRLVTRELLGNFGFIIFEGHKQLDPIPFEDELAVRNSMQFLHQDGQRTKNQKLLDEGVVVFRPSTTGTRKRKSFTALGDKDDLLKAHHDLADSSSKDKNKICAQLGNEMRSFEEYSNLESACDSRYCYRDLEELNRSLLPDLYLHSYGEDELLMIDNSGMAHTRFSTTERPMFAHDGFTFVSQFYWDGDGSLVACEL